MNATIPVVPPALSVVVPTHNRRASVVRLLHALRAELSCGTGVRASDVEVIVVSDGSSDDTVERLQSSNTAGDWPFALQVVVHDVPRGPGIARNSGAAIARGATLLFIDDDIEPFDGALALHHRLHKEAAEREEVLVVIGAPVPLRARDYTLEHVSAWGWWEQQFERMSRPGHRFTYDEVFTGILSMPRATFESVGGFDSALGGCHEDSELGLRLFRAGARATFSRAAGGVHHEVRSTAQLLPRKFDEGRADVQLLRRWPELTMVVRASDRLPRLRSADGLLRRNALAGGWLSGMVPRVALPVLHRLDRWRLRNTWRRVHGALLWHRYWCGVGAEAGSRAALETLRRESAEALVGWRADARRTHIDLADGLDVAARQLDAQRPDAITVRFGDDVVGDIDAAPGAERLHGGHLRRLLAASLANSLAVAMALRELRELRARTPASNAPTAVDHGASDPADTEAAHDDWMARSATAPHRAAEVVPPDSAC